MGRNDSAVRQARSLLFVPGNRPDRFGKAAASGADLVICDLEDAVPGPEKDSARKQVAACLRDGGAAGVRLNAAGSAWWDEDVAALGGLAGLAFLVVPKAEDPDSLTRLWDRLAVPVVPLVENAYGLSRVSELAAARGVARLAFGSIDYARDVDCAEDDLALLYARSALVVASRVAGLAAPVDGVTTQLDDDRAVRADAHRARRLGFGGKLCVHPSQVEPVHAAMSPSSDDVAHAERVVAAAGSGQAARMDGQMVDQAVVERSLDTLRRAARYGVPAEAAALNLPDTHEIGRWRWRR